MLPYLIYVILATKRYLHFENVGTFNIRWHLKWFTKLKIFLSLTMAVLNTYEFIQYNYGGISEILMILIEVAVWLSYGPFSLSISYNFVGSALYLLLTTMIANQTQQSATDQQLNLLLIVEACLQLIFLLIVVWKPKDFPYSNRMKKMSMSLIPKKEYLSFSKLSAGLSILEINSLMNPQQIPFQPSWESKNLKCQNLYNINLTNSVSNFYKSNLISQINPQNKLQDFLQHNGKYTQRKLT
eukprot:403368824